MYVTLDTYIVASLNLKGSPEYAVPVLKVALLRSIRTEHVSANLK